MTEVPPQQDPLEDIDEYYRRLSALDPSRPSGWVHRAVLDSAARLARERAAKIVPVKTQSRRTANWPWWRPAIFGTLAAATLAGILIAPRYLLERTSPMTTPLEAPVSHTVAAVPPVAPATTTDLSPKTKSADQQPPAPLAAQSARAAAPALSVVAPIEDFAEALRRAAAKGDTQELRALLDRHVDIDARDASGRTALMLATLQGQASAIDQLLAFGADPNAADARGTTSLQAAVSGDHEAIAVKLRRAGAR